MQILPPEPGRVAYWYSQNMVRFTVLASGSKGNSSVITAGHTRILVDAGLSCRELFRRMQLVGEDPTTLDAIIITHEHTDHINGLAVTARKLGIPVYFTESTHRAWVRQLTPRKRMTYAEWLAKRREQVAACEVTEAALGADEAADAETEFFAEQAETSDSSEKKGTEPIASAETTQPAKPPSRAEEPAWLPSVEYFTAGVPFSIGEIAVSPFTIPHDAADPVGFIFSAEGLRLALATDLGYLPPNVKAQLKGVDLLHIESNHDLEMLRDGPYPWAIKQRVLSRVGHLSNDATAEFLESEYDGQAAYVILAHLSESNNLPELARLRAEQALSSHAALLANRLLLAHQHEPLPPINL